ncbi:ferrous iron transport protein B [Propioniciclava sp. MC1683]|uniref:ferrous iron transport protein B n=1 Tax=Propioniciclava sp. MC1683 TaxID=2760309 RepID=UPI0016004BB6|nr:ferrous iron transport protein B [Propioniciclava sp. MC1683]MBB1502419.1 ferrous iron transport protein B [Propioniciclava sp. MC1683]
MSEAPEVTRTGGRQLPISPKLPTVRAACHGPVGADAGAGAPIIALAGAPNVGKSTLFNALTGLRATTGNWPGTTVDVGRGAWRFKADDRVCACVECSGECAVNRVHEFSLVDLPGTYSLDPLSRDEELTRTLLVDAPVTERPDAVVVVADAAHLARSLYLVAQLRETTHRVVVALTMNDVARKAGIEVDSYALAEALGCPVVVLDPRRRQGLDNLTRSVREALGRPSPEPRPVPHVEDALDRDDERFAWVEAAVRAGTTASGAERVSTSDKVDRVATHPVAGPLVFLAVMWLVFQVTTTVAAPLQDWLDGFFTGPVSDAVRGGLALVGLGGSWVEGLLVDGLVAGVGMLLTFVPLMALMFVLLALLEDSGYMARAAVVTDRLMRMIGLPGKAFLPLVVGFGCNVPAIAATRILGDARQRILVALLVPFTSCTARLTVYVMLGTIFFGRYAGTAVFVMYLASILAVIGVGLLLRKTLWRTMGSEPLVLDLPPYHLPTARLTAAVAWGRLEGFLRTASGIILVTVCAVWLLQAIPAKPGAGFNDVPVQDSAYGVAAQAIAPVFEPAGFGQWQTASALVVGFVAKEAVISSWAQTYAVDEPAEGEPAGSFGEAVVSSFEASSGGHPLPAVAAFLWFLMAYTPCVATLAAQKREVGWRWTLFGVAMGLAVAWLGAVTIFQVGRLFW